MNILTYNGKLIFWQKLDLLIFPAAIGALTLAMWYTAQEKSLAITMLFEMISPLILGLLLTDMYPRELTWRAAEITFSKPLSPARVLYLRYFLVLVYGISTLLVITIALSSTDYFRMRSFFAAIPVIMVVTALSMLLSLVLGQHGAAAGVVLLFFLEVAWGTKFLPLFLFLETLVPGYEHFWINRALWLLVSFALYAIGFHLLKNPEKVRR